jgi:penicillin-binding protein 1C
MIRTIFKKYKYRILAALFFVLIIFYLSLPKPLFSDPFSTVISSENGELLGARIASDGQWRFPGNSNVPDKFKTCILQFEDQHFYYHPGFNPVSIAKALSNNISKGKISRGGSTITMQVIRLARKGKSRTYFEKVIEIWLATRLECSFSKDEILAMYSRFAPFGGNVVGLEAAAWRYFGRSVNDLTWAESATLAVLPNAPSLMFPGKNTNALKNKRNRLLKKLLENDKLNKDEYQLALSEPMPGKPHPIPQISNHLLQRAMHEHGAGQHFTSTIVPDIQQRVMEATQAYQSRWAVNGVKNAAVLVIDVDHGRTIAYVGNLNSTDKFNGSYNDIILAERSTGSILKPFLYAGMLQQGELYPNSLQADVPTQIAGYAPKNYNQTYAGAVPARTAISRSLNVPAVRMLRHFGIGKFHALLGGLGMKTLHRPANDYGLSLILGGAETRLWDLCSMYGQLAHQLKHQGRKDENTWTTLTYLNDSEKKNVQSRPKILSNGVIYEMFEAMAKVNRPDAQSGWADFLSRRQVAWKTGTSFGQRDAWALGVTPGYVVGVWVGNASGEGRPLLTGVEAAGPVLFDVLALLPNSGWFASPSEDMARIPICKLSGDRAGAWCESTLETVPKTCLNGPICRFHKQIHIDPRTGLQSSGKCLEVDILESKNYFILPPLMEFYYRNNHPEYVPLPAWTNGCEPEDIQVPMAFIYPPASASLVLPKSYDGKPTAIIAEVTHRDKEQMLFWFLDGKRLPNTKVFHQQQIQPEPGEHVLLVIDQKGRQISRKFTLLSR